MGSVKYIAVLVGVAALLGCSSGTELFESSGSGAGEYTDILTAVPQPTVLKKYVQERNYFTLVCGVSRYTPTFTVAFKNYTYFVDSSNFQNSNISQRFGVLKYTTNTTLYLRVHNVRKSDAGVWSCIAASETIKVDIVVVKQIVVKCELDKVSCYAQGAKSILLKQYGFQPIEGKMYAEENFTSITDQEKRRSLNYKFVTCIVTYPDTKTRRRYCETNVSYSPLDVEISHQPEKSDIVLGCKSDANPPAIYWYWKDELSGEWNMGDMTKVVPGAGTYKCMVEQASGHVGYGTIIIRDQPDPTWPAKLSATLILVFILCVENVILVVRYMLRKKSAVTPCEYEMVNV